MSRTRRRSHRQRAGAPRRQTTASGPAASVVQPSEGRATWAPARGVTWKRQEVVSPPTVARAVFLAARGLADDADGGADPLLAVSAAAWADLRAHARSASVEVGGFLVGEACRDETGRWLIDAQAAIPALGAVQEAAYFRLTEAAWDHVSRERSALHPDLLTVGWYHTHPGLGVFFSGTDRASQRAFFARPWNVGVVIDPRRDEVALFRGAESERLPTANLVVYDGAAAIGPKVARDGVDVAAGPSATPVAADAPPVRAVSPPDLGAAPWTNGPRLPWASPALFAAGVLALLVAFRRLLRLAGRVR